MPMPFKLSQDAYTNKQDEHPQVMRGLRVVVLIQQKSLGNVCKAMLHLQCPEREFASSIFITTFPSSRFVWWSPGFMLFALDAQFLQSGPVGVLSCPAWMPVGRDDK